MTSGEVLCHQRVKLSEMRLFPPRQVRFIIRAFSLTSQLCQWVKTPLFFPCKKTVTVQKVGPSHVYCIKSREAIFFQVFTNVPAGLYNFVLFTLWGQHWAAQEPQVWVAFSLEQVVQHADENVLGAVLNHFSSLLIQEIRIHCLSIGNISTRT